MFKKSLYKHFYSAFIFKKNHVFDGLHFLILGSVWFDFIDEDKCRLIDICLPGMAPPL